MKYTAPDGHVMTSDSTQPVVYVCDNVYDYTEGTFNSLETQSSNNAYGIKQIKVQRVVTETDITITITESTDAELEEYLASIIRENNILSDLTSNDLLNN